MQFKKYVLLILVLNTIILYASSTIKKRWVPIVNSEITFFVPQVSVQQAPVCEIGYKLVYALVDQHPNGEISSNSNKIDFIKLCQDNTNIKLIKRYNIGTFKDKPNLYDTFYVYDNKPSYGYDIYQVYNGTSYEGLNERYMYASHSIAELTRKINQDVKSGSCSKSAANFDGGDLNSYDNFWTYFCPEVGLVTYLNEHF